MAHSFGGGMLALGLAVAPAGYALAHHSLAAYDTSKSITVQGTVKEFSWKNPHCWLNVIADDPKRTEWVFEAGPPTITYRLGWRRTDLKPGDKVTVKAMPVRDGAPHGAIRSITLADGRVMSGPVNTQKSAPPPK